MLDSSFWNNRYLENNTGWDIGEASLPLTSYINQLQDKNLAVLIPGCGNAYEAEHLLKQGFTNITLVDIAEQPIKELQTRFYPQHKRELNIIHADFFDLKGKFDLILEQTFFCALHPSLRGKYATKMFDLLKPKGKLVGVLFNTEFEKEGPPFGGNKALYSKYFSQLFEIKYMDECYNSIPPRKGNELFVSMIRP